MRFGRCNILGIPVDVGAGQAGCEMGPAAFRIAGLAEAIAAQGMEVQHLGDVDPGPITPIAGTNPTVRHAGAFRAWTEAGRRAGLEAGRDAFPVFLGGDHSLAAGTLTAMAARAGAMGRPLFVLWLDAHSDFHTAQSTVSGNLHGVPLAYACGLPGFSDIMPPPEAAIDPARVCMMGVRSVDPAERVHLSQTSVIVHDMREIDEFGMAPLLRAFLSRVEAAGGTIHVSLDVDFLDPAIAPAVGTTVPGGATFREAHLVMEMLHESGLVSSLDLVELNPFLDERGRTALLMVDLAASLFGKKVMDRPNRTH
jgi:arginase